MELAITAREFRMEMLFSIRVSEVRGGLEKLILEVCKNKSLGKERRSGENCCEKGSRICALHLHEGLFFPDISGNR